MINSIKFRIGSGLSIPIYSDWIKSKLINIQDDNLIITVDNDIPVDIATAMHNLQPVGFIILASDNVDFASVDHSLENMYNAIEFDLYRRSMTIGFADPLILDDIDNWRYQKGIAVQLQLRVKVIEEEGGAIGLSISANNDVSAEMMMTLRDIAGDGYRIAVDNDVPTWHNIGEHVENDLVHGVTNALQIRSVNQTLSSVGGNNLALDGDVEHSSDVKLSSTYSTGIHLDHDVETGRAINIEYVNDGMIHITGGAAGLMSIREALQSVSNGIDVDGEEFDVNFGVSVARNGAGESYLVLQAPDSMEIESDRIPCANVTIDGATDVYVYNSGELINLQYTVTPSITTDAVVITSSNTSVVDIVNGVPVSTNCVGDAQITVTCGEQSASITVRSSRIMDPDDVIGFFVSGATTQGGGRYANAASISGVQVACKYSGMSEPWGDGRYVSLKSREPNHIHPYKLPDNCNCVSVTVPDTFAGHADYRVLFFDSTRDGCFGDNPSSGYAYWLSTSPSSSGHETSQAIIVDPDADSFVMSYVGNSYDYFTGCVVELLHVDS